MSSKMKTTGMIRESAIVTHNSNIISFSVGTAGAVEFDFLKIWEYVKKSGCDPCELAFYHVHPHSFQHYSSLDEECLAGFVLAFGGDIYFSIIIFENNDLCNLTYMQLSYQYINGMVEAKDQPLSHDQLLFLKWLSYGDRN